MGENRKDKCLEQGPAYLNPIVVTLVTSRSPTLATKLELRDGLTMKRCIAMAILVCSSTSVVLFHRFSLAQQDESEVERKVLSKVAPTYPDLARKTNIHGAVKLGVVIAPDGRVESTRVIGGNPVLIQAALDAVRKWKYEAGPQRTNEVVELKFNTR
jgi:TonB family protein